MLKPRNYNIGPKWKLTQRTSPQKEANYSGSPHADQVIFASLHLIMWDICELLNHLCSKNSFFFARSHQNRSEKKQIVVVCQGGNSIDKILA